MLTAAVPVRIDDGLAFVGSSRWAASAGANVAWNRIAIPAGDYNIHLEIVAADEAEFPNREDYEGAGGWLALFTR